MLPAFEIDPRVPMMIDFDLAVRVGEFIVNSGTPDKQIMAFGHRLLALEQKAEENKKWIPRPERPAPLARRVRVDHSSSEDFFGEGIK